MLFIFPAPDGSFSILFQTKKFGKLFLRHPECFSLGPYQFAGLHYTYPVLCPVFILKRITRAELLSSEISIL